jgi:preprotein translocase SecF subunit
MMHIIPTGRNFDFMGKRRLWIGVSIAVIVISMGGFAMRYPKNLGIDFLGGDMLTLTSKNPVTVAEVHQVVDGLGLGEIVVQKEKSEVSEFITIRSPADTADTVENKLKEALPQAGFVEHQKDHVGKIVGGELMKGSAIALGLGMLMILIYVTMRFELSFAVGALVALFHDVAITIGLFSLAGHELSLVMVGAILTIAGYSINDTIVVYDRIREGLRSGRKGSIQEIMNASINETLSRTLLTSGCTFLSVASLFFFGGLELRDFAFAMLVGIIVGTYSSIFIASPIVLWWSGQKGHALREEVELLRRGQVGA